MKYGKHLIQRTKFIAIAIVGFNLFHLVSCGANNRLQRILKNHPELAKIEVRDSIVVVEGKKIDTFFSIKATHDTIQYAGISIIRYRDSFRLIGRTQPCTTIIRQSRTVIGDTTRKPSRAEIRQQRKETKVKETEQRENRKNRYYMNFLCLSIVINVYLMLRNFSLKYLNE